MGALTLISADMLHSPQTKQGIHFHRQMQLPQFVQYLPDGCNVHAQSRQNQEISQKLVQMHFYILPSLEHYWPYMGAGYWPVQICYSREVTETKTVDSSNPFQLQFQLPLYRAWCYVQ